MPLISIIVPVYKVKEIYLRQCIESLVNQTFKDIEIILIDDGTPDNGGVVCDEYALHDNRVKVLHQENQGVSSARNKGIDVATGDWITFVDADDWIELDACEKLKNIILQEDLDLLLFALKVNFTKKEVENPFWDEEFAYLDKKDREELQIQLLYKTVSKFSPPYSMVGVAVCKLYRTQFLKEKNFKFNTELELSEDGLFAFWALEEAQKVIYVNEFLYHYRKHSESATYRYRKNAETDYGNGMVELEKCLKVTHKNQRFYTAYYYRTLLNISAICNQLHCHKLNDKPILKKVNDIKKLCNSEPYISAIKNTSIKHYFAKSGTFQKVGFIFLKFRLYLLYYSLILLRKGLKKY
ncbi:glycosyltransferase [Bacillus sp. B15-48]|uniref:glycosyltransferase family 2 protein n=1 Tax=Bacillus sp. B15-48 TaxID=1548601 RepID=UPI00193EFCC8|nr:glycosyltransferase [Bacillus sp. B15-48]MBM4761459.1 glycosyltransferase [Bacillus sp. B15-48]